MYHVDQIKNNNWKKFSRSNLPIKYLDHKIEDFRILGDTPLTKKQNKQMFDEFMDYYNTVEERLRKGEGIFICGSIGIAKTWLMTHLAKKIIDIFDLENERIQDEGMDLEKYANKFYYIQATTLNQMVFATGLNEKELNIRRGIKTIAGLWIDDISKMAETKGGHELAFLDDILRWRDLNGLATFYTSQIPFTGKDGTIGFDNISLPLHDIIRGNCIILSPRGESQR